MIFFAPAHHYSHSVRGDGEITVIVDTEAVKGRSRRHNLIPVVEYGRAILPEKLKGSLLYTPGLGRWNNAIDPGEDVPRLKITTEL
jgi:hypothetical protein